MQTSNWSEPYYYSIGDYYKNVLGEKTYKISVTIAEDCPNRQGLKKMETCIFCDVWGSAAYEDNLQKDLSKQIEELHAFLSKRYKAKKFLVYFQSYTNTFMGVKKLREFFDTALSYKFVSGIVIGTRPDCISKANLQLWQEYSEKTYVSVELGAQSFFDEHLEFVKRGHNAAKSIEAVYRIQENCPKVDIGLHFIFGMPNESDEQIIHSAKLTNALGVDNVKIHNLHVLKNTGLEELYKKGLFEPISLEEFSHKTILFLEHLSPQIPVHRLGALSSRWDELIAPIWNRYKMKLRQFILSRMESQGAYQGRLYQPSSKNLPLFHNSKGNTALNSQSSF